MAQSFPLQIVTPTGIVYEGEAEEVTAEGPLGQFGVLPNHINFITSLVPGIMEVKLPGGEKRHYVVSGGLAEVKDGAMTMLADTAEEPGALKVEEIDVALRDLEGRMVEISVFAEEYDPTYRELMLARARRRAATELRPDR